MKRRVRIFRCFIISSFRLEREYFSAMGETLQTNTKYNVSKKNKIAGYDTENSRKREEKIF